MLAEGLSVWMITKPDQNADCESQLSQKMMWIAIFLPLERNADKSLDC